MSFNGNHLSLEDRKIIEENINKGLRKFETAKELNKSQSTIGTVKKVELLKKFGTVENISNASVEEIAEVKGINEELAVEIKNALIH